MKKPKTLLIDLDCTIVNMLPPWLKRYNEITGESVEVEDIKEYNVGLVCKNEEVLYKILDEEGFFYNMEPMPGAVENLQKLLDDDRFDVVIVTQPPRRADRAVKDKRRWIRKYFPKFDLSNVIFCHRKELIKGDLIFDDKPTHLINWRKNNPRGILATLDWKFTTIPTHFKGSLENGWDEFYKFVIELAGTGS